MRAALALALLLLAGPDQNVGQVQLMDAIEKALVLPPRAHPLGDYARFYAFEADGKVVGRYVIPERAEPETATGCLWVGRNGKTRVEPCPPSRAWPEGVAAGERKWVADPASVPGMSDGGCRQVNLLYHPRSGKVEWVFCNGFG